MIKTEKLFETLTQVAMEKEKKKRFSMKKVVAKIEEYMKGVPAQVKNDLVEKHQENIGKFENPEKTYFPILQHLIFEYGYNVKKAIDSVFNDCVTITKPEKLQSIYLNRIENVINTQLAKFDDKVKEEFLRYGKKQLKNIDFTKIDKDLRKSSYGNVYYYINC